MEKTLTAFDTGHNASSATWRTTKMIRFFTRSAAIMGVFCAMTNVVSAEELTLGGILTELHRADLTGRAGMEVIVSNYVVKPGGKFHCTHTPETNTMW
jgi:hypothetical protein